MGSVLEELSLDYKPKFVPRMISDFVKEVSLVADVSDRVSKLDNFVKKLEDELKKIDVFKRELPLCMVLLNDAIVILKEESRQLQCVTSSKKQQQNPLFEEFIPLKTNSDVHDHDHKENGLITKENDFRDKKNWLSSVQLWNSDDRSSKDSVFNQNVESKNENQYQNGGVFQSCKSRNEAKDLMLLSRPIRKEDDRAEDLSVPSLSLLTPGITSSRDESGSKGFRISCSKGVSSSAAKLQPNLQNALHQLQPPTARKQRRCWSPELHHRFVNALERLGGCQAATPKQIRELMQVDGLTNDEVKSHLQKYRLHSRKMPTSTTTSANQAISLGSLWMSQDHGDSGKPNISQSGSPEGPLQLAAQTGGHSDNSMDEDEDVKSEGYSWKDQIHRSDDV